VKLQLTAIQFRRGNQKTIFTKTLLNRRLASVDSASLKLGIALQRCLTRRSGSRADIKAVPKIKVKLSDDEIEQGLYSTRDVSSYFTRSAILSASAGTESQGTKPPTNTQLAFSSVPRNRRFPSRCAMAIRLFSRLQSKLANNSPNCNGALLRNSFFPDRPQKKTVLTAPNGPQCAGNALAIEIRSFHATNRLSVLVDGTHKIILLYENNRRIYLLVN